MIGSLAAEWKYYLLFCGIFQKTPIKLIKEWDTYESCFTRLIQTDGEENGPKRLVQAFALYLGVYLKGEKYESKIIDNFLVKLYQNSVLKGDLIVGWLNNEIKSDKRCVLYHRPSEKVLRELKDPFLEWYK